ncbi:hypothetical protein B0H14DRAFT_3631175 [Mycena olivaceomarginata]|nr:hypothetical protein B0H14DRAFT_3631175 [Mycena olivaceomarginata]
MNGHAAVVELLLKHGANVHDFWANIALREACERGHEGVVKVLLLHGGANVRWTASELLELASSPEHEAVAKLLLDHGVKINASSWSGWIGQHDGPICTSTHRNVSWAEKLGPDADDWRLFEDTD